MPTAPTWKWEWNLNTIVMLVGLSGGLIAWGYTLSSLETGRQQNAGNIEKLEARIVALETNTRRLDNHELRIATVEKQAVDTATSMRAVEGTLSALTTDIRVVREILQRLESRSGSDRVPP